MADTNTKETQSQETQSQETQSQEFQYKAEMKQLLHLLIHSLYTHPDIFLRELISNSSDALNKVRFNKLTDTKLLDFDAELKIKIQLDKEAGTLTIEDTGIGMTKEDLINRLGTVASSGTIDFIKNIKDSGNVDKNMIGKFGVGFYSVFMVADEVIVETRYSEADSKAVKWTSKGEDSYVIEESERAERGTKITIKLKEDNKEYLDDYRVKNILKKYSNFVDFPIDVNGEKTNTVDALWHKKDKDLKEEELQEFYKFISGDFGEYSDYIKLDIEGRVSFKALLFIPKVAPQNLFTDQNYKTLHLYSSNVFIQDDSKEIVPDYLRFVKGVIDTEDLPLNVSREVTQSSPVIAKIREVITGKLLSKFEELAEKDNEAYDKFFREFGSLFKTGTTSDFTNKSRLMELLRFETTKTEGSDYTSLNKYFSNMKDTQEAIYYISGNSKEQIEKNPNLEYFRKNDIEVLFLTDPVDLFVVPYFGEYEDKSFISIEKADIKIDEKEDEADNKIDDEAKTSFIDFVKKELGDKVENVIESKRLVDSACTLVVGKEGMDSQMEKMMQMMDKNFSISKRIFEINMRHPLIKNLSELYTKDADSDNLKKSIEQLYEGSLLMEGYLKNPADFVQRMTDFMTEATK